MAHAYTYISPQTHMNLIMFGPAKYYKVHMCLRGYVLQLQCNNLPRPWGKLLQFFDLAYYVISQECWLEFKTFTDFDKKRY